MKSETLFNRPADTFISDKNAGSVEGSDFGATETPLSNRSLLSEASQSAFSTFMAVRNEQDKSFVPLPGNWHRITGLIQRNSVVQKRTTLSQAT